MCVVSPPSLTGEGFGNYGYRYTGLQRNAELTIGVFFAVAELLVDFFGDKYLTCNSYQQNLCTIFTRNNSNTISLTKSRPSFVCPRGGSGTSQMGEMGATIAAGGRGHNMQLN